MCWLNPSIPMSFLGLSWEPTAQLQSRKRHEFRSWSRGSQCLRQPPLSQRGVFKPCQGTRQVSPLEDPRTPKTIDPKVTEKWLWGRRPPHAPQKKGVGNKFLGHARVEKNTYTEAEVVHRRLWSFSGHWGIDPPDSLLSHFSGHLICFGGSGLFRLWYWSGASLDAQKEVKEYFFLPSRAKELSPCKWTKCRKSRGTQKGISHFFPVSVTFWQPFSHFFDVLGHFWAYRTPIPFYLPPFAAGWTLMC